MKKIYSKNYIRFRRNLLYFFVIVGLGLFFCFRVGQVQAGENDGMLEKNRYNGVYAVTNLNGERHLYYLDMYSINQIVAYCIDLGKAILSQSYHSTDNFAYFGMDEVKIRYIQAIAYFGYGYHNHSDYRYYMAAQELIWEYLSGAEVYWTNEFSVDGSAIDIESYKREILAFVDIARKEIALDVDSDILKINSHYQFNDLNGMLNYYKVYSHNFRNVSISNNQLSIDVKGDYVGRVDIVFEWKYRYNHDGKLYYYGDSQKLITVGNYRSLFQAYSFEIRGATLSGYIVDGDTKENVPKLDTSFSEARYSLYDSDGNYVTNFVTDKDGYFEVENLPYGDYVIRQEEASLGYQKNEEEVLFEFSEDNTSVVLEEYVIYNDFEFLKVKVDGDMVLPEEGVVFSIYNRLGEKVMEVKSEVDGYCKFRLDYGTYVVKQENTDNGYLKIEDFSLKVVEMKKEIIHYFLKDAAIRYRVLLHTCDAVSKDYILSSEFSYQVIDAAKGEVMKYGNDSIFESDKEGKVEFPMSFLYGEYFIEQISSDNNYLLNEDGVRLVIDDNSKVDIIDGQAYINVDVCNNRKTAENSGFKIEVPNTFSDWRKGGIIVLGVVFLAIFFKKIICYRKHS